MTLRATITQWSLLHYEISTQYGCEAVPVKYVQAQTQKLERQRDRQGEHTGVDKNDWNWVTVI